MTPFDKCNKVQKDKIMELYLSLDLSTFNKESEDDKEGIILVKNLLQENINKDKKI